MESPQMTLEDEFSFKSEIIDLLNDFGESAVDNYSPLIITKGDFFALFELTKEQFRHIKETIDFVKNDCTASQFSWMSEVWDEIAEKTKSKEFINCIKETAKKFPEECAKFNIAGSIESAEGYL